MHVGDQLRGVMRPSSAVTTGSVNFLSMMLLGGIDSDFNGRVRARKAHALPPRCTTMAENEASDDRSIMPEALNGSQTTDNVIIVARDGSRPFSEKREAKRMKYSNTMELIRKKRSTTLKQLKRSKSLFRNALDTTIQKPLDNINRLHEIRQTRPFKLSPEEKRRLMKEADEKFSTGDKLCKSSFLGRDDFVRLKSFEKKGVTIPHDTMKESGAWHRAVDEQWRKHHKDHIINFERKLSIRNRSVNGGLMDDSFASISSSVATEESLDNETKSLAQGSSMQISKDKLDGRFLRHGYIGQQLQEQRNFIQLLLETNHVAAQVPHKSRRHKDSFGLHSFFRKRRPKYLSGRHKIEDVVIPSCNQGYRLRMLMGATKNKAIKVPPIQPLHWKY
eukprot:g10642.t1